MRLIKLRAHQLLANNKYAQELVSLSCALWVRAVNLRHSLKAPALETPQNQVQPLPQWQCDSNFCSTHRPTPKPYMCAVSSSSICYAPQPHAGAPSHKFTKHASSPHMLHMHCPSQATRPQNKVNGLGQTSQQQATALGGQHMTGSRHPTLKHVAKDTRYL